MHTYDLTHFQNELPEALWKYLLTFLIGKLEKEFLNIFERATTEVMNNIQRLLDHPNAPICHLPLVVGAFMLKCKNITQCAFACEILQITIDVILIPHRPQATCQL